MPVTISAATQAVSTVTTAIAGIADASKRRLIEANLAMLSESQQIALAKQIQAQKNSNDRTTILVNTIMAARNANADRQQKAETVKWILIGSMGLATLIVIAWYMKK